jgi:hypothetical protein
LNTGIMERWNKGKVKRDTECWILDAGKTAIPECWNDGMVE